MQILARNNLHFSILFVLNFQTCEILLRSCLSTQQCTAGINNQQIVVVVVVVATAVVVDVLVDSLLY